MGSSGINAVHGEKLKLKLNVKQKLKLSKKKSLRKQLQPLQVNQRANNQVHFPFWMTMMHFSRITVLKEEWTFSRPQANLEAKTFLVVEVTIFSHLLQRKQQLLLKLANLIFLGPVKGMICSLLQQRRKQQKQI